MTKRKGKKIGIMKLYENNKHLRTGNALNNGKETVVSKEELQALEDDTIYRDEDKEEFDSFEGKAVLIGLTAIVAVIVFAIYKYSQK